MSSNSIWHKRHFKLSIRHLPRTGSIPSLAAQLRPHSPPSQQIQFISRTYQSFGVPFGVRTIFGSPKKWNDTGWVINTYLDVKKNNSWLMTVKQRDKQGIATISFRCWQSLDFNASLCPPATQQLSGRPAILNAAKPAQGSAELILGGWKIGQFLVFCNIFS